VSSYDRLTLLIVGPNSSGKSSAAQYLASVLNGVIIEFGDLVRQQISADATLPRDPSRAYEELLRRHDSGLLTLWAKSITLKCEKTQALIMVGVRDEPSYRNLLDAFPCPIRIAVAASLKKRRMRDAAKQFKCDATSGLSEVAFSKRDALHRSWGLETSLEKQTSWYLTTGVKEHFTSGFGLSRER
jgi:adenylate kinase family enzyme